MTGEYVLKFGGSALRDAEAVGRACELIRSHGGSRPVVVVSAHFGVTSLLSQLAGCAIAGAQPDTSALRLRHRSLLSGLGLSSESLDRYMVELISVLEELRRLGRPEQTLIDSVLSFGERVSARIVAGALRSCGSLATPVDAFDLGISTTRPGAAPEAFGLGALAAVRQAVAEVPGIPVVTGFLALDPQGRLTTLGSNGSDLTALLLAEAVQAEEVQLWKTVPGVLTADPVKVPQATTVPVVGYNEALELALHGAEVLHPEAALRAGRIGVPVRICNALDPLGPHTDLAESTPQAGPLGIVHRSGLLRATLPVAGSEELARIASRLTQSGARWPWLEWRAARVRVVVPDGEAQLAALDELGADSIERGLGALALIGRELGSDASILARVLRELDSLGVEVHQASFGALPSSQAFLLSAKDLERALGALHHSFFELAGAY